MRFYEFDCKRCGAERTIYAREPEPPLCCGEPMTRRYSAPTILRRALGYPFFHRGLGEVVYSPADEEEKLERFSAKLSERYGSDVVAEPCPDIGEFAKCLDSSLYHKVSDTKVELAKQEDFGDSLPADFGVKHESARD